VSGTLVPAGVRLAATADVPEGAALVVHVGEGEGRVSLVLTRRAGAFHAFRNRCTHADYPLQRADGRVLVQQGRFIVCGAHGASYALDTGACAGGPCNGKGLTRVAIVERDGALFGA